LLARFVDRTLVEHRVRAAEIDVFEDARARRNATGGAVSADGSVQIDFDELARLDLSFEVGADNIESDRFTGEYYRMAEPTHDQRPNPQGVAHRGHSARRHDHQRIGTLDHPQRIHQLVEHRWIAAGRDEMDDDLGVGGRLEDCAFLHKL